MAAKKKNASKPATPAEPATLVNELWVKATGSDNVEVHYARINEIISSLWPGRQLAKSK